MVRYLYSMRYCKGLCENKYISQKKHLRVYDVYGRCSVCEVWIELPAIKCPCCSTILRTKPKRSSHRKKYIGINN